MHLQSSPSIDEEIKRKKEYHFLIVVLFLCILVGFGHYFFFTAQGSKTAARLILKTYAGCREVFIGGAKGTLINGLYLEDLELKGLKFLPQGSFIKVQKITLSLHSLTAKGFAVDIFNGRLWMGGEDPVLFYGSYKDGDVDLSIYTKRVDVDDVLQFFDSKEIARDLTGTVTDFDATVKGSFLEPVAVGDFLLQSLQYKDFSMTNSHGAFDLKLKKIHFDTKIFGGVSLQNGKLVGLKTAIVNLLPSKIIFNGSLTSPTLNAQAVSSVGKIKIMINIRGAVDSPDLELTSEPSVAQQRLLLMLATGRSWSSLDTLGTQETISPELAGDFLDYFLFSGKESEIADHFGIKNFSLKYDDTTKGIRITKDLDSRTEASYSIDQNTDQDGKSSTTQTIGQEYKLTDRVSVGAQKQFSQTDAKSDSKKDQEGSKVILKYKKSF